MDPTVDNQAEQSDPARKGSAWTTLDLVLSAGLTLAGGALRFWRLGTPNAQFFDEGFYAKDACFYVKGVEESCGLTGRIIEVHPPMGKWLIGSGIKIFGFEPFGFRLASALAGALLIFVVYLLGKRLFKSSAAATVAALFVALDFLHFVHSRLAMLDIFLPLFLALGFLLLVYDRDGPPATWRKWRLLAGACFGAAIATKWTAAPALIGAFALVVFWRFPRRSEQEKGRFIAFVRAEGPSLLLSFVLVPLTVYMLTYAGRVPGSLFAWPWDPASWWAGFWRQQRFMWDYFSLSRQLHSYQSFAWTWLSTRHAYPYYFDSRGTTFGGIVGAGSPAMWIPVIPAALFAIVKVVRARDARADVVVPLVGFFSTYGLWLVPSLFGYEHFFIYYLLPSIPFMALLVAALVPPLLKIRLGRVLLVLLLSVWVGLFAFMYPMLAAVPITPSKWDARVDLYALCPVSEATAESFKLTRLLDEACQLTRIVTEPQAQR